MNLVWDDVGIGVDAPDWSAVGTNHVRRHWSIQIDFDGQFWVRMKKPQHSYAWQSTEIPLMTLADAKKWCESEEARLMKTDLPPVPPPKRNLALIHGLIIDLDEPESDDDE